MVLYFYPADSKILQEFITQESHKLDIAPRPPMAVTNAVSWRSEGIKYRKNEVFLDVIGSRRLLSYYEFRKKTNIDGSVIIPVLEFVCLY